MSNGNGFGKGLRIGWTILIILLAVGTYAGSYAVLRSTVVNHEKRIERNEVVILDIKETLAEIANNQKWMMRRMK